MGCSMLTHSLRDSLPYSLKKETIADLSSRRPLPLDAVQTIKSSPFPLLSPSTSNYLNSPVPTSTTAAALSPPSHPKITSYSPSWLAHLTSNGSTPPPILSQCPPGRSPFSDAQLTPLPSNIHTSPQSSNHCYAPSPDSTGAGQAGGDSIVRSFPHFHPSNPRQYRSLSTFPLPICFPPYTISPPPPTILTASSRREGNLPLV